MILSYIHFGEKISWQKILGLAIAMGALVPVLNLQSGAEDLLGYQVLFLGQNYQ